MFRVDTHQADLKAKIRQVEEEVFKHPPQTFEAFQQRFGIWLGLNAALNSMNELVKQSLANEANE